MTFYCCSEGLIIETLNEYVLAINDVYYIYFSCGSHNSSDAKTIINIVINY